MSYESDIAQHARDSASVCEAAARQLREAARELGFAGPASIEVRYAGKLLDEVVAKNVMVHLEDMGGHWSLIIEGQDGKRVMLALTSKKCTLVEQEGEIVEVRK